MSITFKPMSSSADAVFERWRRLSCIVRKAEAIVTTSIAQIDRAERVRAASPAIAIGKSAALLARVTEAARDGHAALAVVPEFLEAAKADLREARAALDEELGHE